MNGDLALLGEPVADGGCRIKGVRIVLRQIESQRDDFLVLDRNGEARDVIVVPGRNFPVAERKVMNPGKRLMYRA